MQHIAQAHYRSDDAAAGKADGSEKSRCAAGIVSFAIECKCGRCRESEAHKAQKRIDNALIRPDAQIEIEHSGYYSRACQHAYAAHFDASLRVAEFCRQHRSQADKQAVNGKKYAERDGACAIMFLEYEGCRTDVAEEYGLCGGLLQHISHEHTVASHHAQEFECA